MNTPTNYTLTDGTTRIQVLEGRLIYHQVEQIGNIMCNGEEWLSTTDGRCSVWTCSYFIGLIAALRGM